MKKFLSKLSILLLVLSITLGFGGVTAFAYSEEAVVQVTDYYFQIWNQSDFQQYIDMGAITDEFVLEQYTQWQELKNQIGTYEEHIDTKVEEIEDTVVVTLVEKFTNSNMNFVITFDKAAAEQDPSMAILSIEAMQPTAGAGQANMGKAAMNTLMGMGIVFLVLIFISIIIGLLKYVPALFAKKTKEELEVLPPSAPVPVAAVQETDDTELAAVITAAIMALRAEENEGADSGFTVRSIRRRRS